MRLLLFLFVFLVLCGCQNRNQNILFLQAADNYMMECDTEEGEKALLRISTADLSREQMAFYFLLRKFRDVRQGKDVELDEARKHICYFNTDRNISHKGRAYHYYSAILNELKQKDSAIIYAKQAEQEAYIQNDSLLMRNVFIDLSWMNSDVGNLNLAISYGKKLLQLSRMRQEKRWIGYALDNYAVLYYYVGQIDSFCKYAEQAISYIPYQPIKEQPYFYNNAAVLYHTKGNIQKEELYLNKALKIHSLPTTYGNLAVFYLNNKQYDKARLLWDKALQEKDPYSKISFKKAYATWLMEQGEMERYAAVNREIIEMKDSLDKVQESERMRDLQVEFDKNLIHQSYQHQTIYMVAGILLLLALIALLCYRYWRSLVNSRQRERQTAVLISQYEKQIEDLKKRSTNKQRKVKALEKKVTDLRERHESMLAKGKAHYDALCNGGNTIAWHKEDFLCFLEYYSTLRPDFIQHLDEDYDSLSPTPKVFLCLLDMGKTEEQVQCALCLTDGALRTLRYRINGKRVQSSVG